MMLSFSSLKLRPTLRKTTRPRIGTNILAGRAVWACVSTPTSCLIQPTANKKTKNASLPRTTPLVLFHSGGALSETQKEGTKTKTKTKTKSTTLWTVVQFKYSLLSIQIHAELPVETADFKLGSGYIAAVRNSGITWGF
jgi:hypothetical protein